METVYSGLYGVSMNVGNFSPLSNREGFTIVSEESIIPFVAMLLLARRPAAVAWLIRPVVIDAVKRMLRRGSPSHIEKEILKLRPAVTNGDTSRAVVTIKLRSGATTAIKHLNPCLMLGSFIHAVRRIIFRSKLSLETPAACSVAITQRDSTYYFLFSAIAATQPIERITASLGRPNSGETTEPLPGNIFYKWVHRRGYIPSRLLWQGVF
jgi:hypothetical protein